jgi:hypothetical protein
MRDTARWVIVVVLIVLVAAMLVGFGALFELLVGP